LYDMSIDCGASRTGAPHAGGAAPSRVGTEPANVAVWTAPGCADALVPDADVLAFQVSLPPARQRLGWALGQALARWPRRCLNRRLGKLDAQLDEFRPGMGRTNPMPQSSQLDRRGRGRGDAARLRQALSRAPYAQRAHPTTEHFCRCWWPQGPAPRRGCHCHRAASRMACCRWTRSCFGQLRADKVPLGERDALAVRALNEPRDSPCRTRSLFNSPSDQRTGSCCCSRRRCQPDGLQPLGWRWPSVPNAGLSASDRPQAATWVPAAVFSVRASTRPTARARAGAMPGFVQTRALAAPNRADLPTPR